MRAASRSCGGLARVDSSAIRNTWVCVRGSRRVFAQDVERVSQTIEDARIQYRRIRQHPQAFSKHQQVSRKIAAVHGRDIARRQRLQRLRVVPVEKVAAMAVQRGKRIERRIAAFDERGRTDIAEIERGKICEQRQADIGRGGAMGNDIHWLLLHVIRRQPMIFGTDIGFRRRPRSGAPVAAGTATG